MAKSTVVAESSSAIVSDPRSWLSERNRVLLALFLLLIPAFALTALTTRAYRREQQRLAAQASTDGEIALRHGRAGDAVVALRTAMSLAATRSRRLRLAQALAAAGRDAEARAHLLTLREGTPGDGLINLELARLAARDADVPHAARYYRDAIEGAWDRAPDTRRREARLELADLLVRHGPRAAAEGELIALAADLPPDPGLHIRVGDLLMEAQQVRRAFDVYTAALRLDPASVRAAQGAGESAFALANYVTARRYFAQVAAAEPTNTHVLGRLEVVTAVIGLDPFARGLSARERARRATVAFETATKRLAACADAVGAPIQNVAPPRESPGVRPPGIGGDARNPAETSTEPGRDELQDLAAGAQALAPQAQPIAIARDPDLLDQVMDLVFRVEEITARRCGEAQDRADQALVLIARDRRATER